jgi:hypothetical protein
MNNKRLAFRRKILPTLSSGFLCRVSFGSSILHPLSLSLSLSLCVYHLITSSFVV